LEASEALGDIKRLRERKRQEEIESERLAREQEEARRTSFHETMAEVTRSIARTYGLPEDAPPDKLLAHMRSQRLLTEFEKSTPEQRERLLHELEVKMTEKKKSL
jgi:hypothetical protein